MSRSARSSSACRGSTTRARCRSTAASASSSTPRSAPTRAACASTRASTSASIKFLGFEQIFKNSLTGHAHRRRQGRLRLRPARQVRRRGHALLPVVHDRAVPPPRRVHRRPGRRHRRRRPRDRLHVRPVQAHHQPLRVRRPDRQGPRLGRLAGAHRGHRLRHRGLRRRDAQDTGRVVRRQAGQRLRLRQRGHLRHREGPPARRHGHHVLRLDGLRRRRGGHRPRPAQADQGGRARPRQRLRRAPRLAPAIAPTAVHLGRARAMSPCRAPRRTS